MPCLVLTGHPCIGKTVFAEKLKERALAHKSKLISSVVIVNEENVCVNQTKAECYMSSQAEKSTRSSLKGVIDRSLNGSTLVICDSLNYIKGYRYELHCLSKASGQRHGVIWLLNSPAVAKEWNTDRSKEKPDYFYTDKQMEELVQRYEVPDARNRWDRPLFRVDLTPDGRAVDTARAAQDALNKSVYNMHSLNDAINTEAAATGQKVKPKGVGFKRAQPKGTTSQPDENTAISPSPNPGASPTLVSASVPSSTSDVKEGDNEVEMKRTLEDQIDDILDSFLLDIAPLKEGFSTRQHLTAHSDVLHNVDSLTLKLCNAIVSAQTQSYGSSILLPKYGVTLQCRRKLTLTELKSLRQQYIRWVALSPPTDSSERGLVESFIEYVSEHLQ